MTSNSALQSGPKVGGAIFSKLWFVAFTVAASIAIADRASAQPGYEVGPPASVQPPPSPSPFQAGMRGFSAGIAVGLAGGYLVARQDGFTSRDWRPLVAGAGIGALAGGALGFTLGIVDNNSMSPGRGFLVMRGMAEGGAFGIVAGAIIGGLAALKTDKPEHILFGAAIGTLAGTAFGLVYGGIERNPWERRGRPVAWNVGVVPYSTSQGTLAFGPSLSGRW
jgi:hypothetical protein